ncbi:MAG: glycosyltransferase family 4 protein [Taibaiella sp.]|nr:glycosyltransferase family 4 protein [Taibaiella sp.]
MTILIIDNSTAFTGAFKCALNEAELLSGEHRFIFVLNKNSTLVQLLRDKGITVYTLPMVEIKRSISVLLLYPFALLRNTFTLLNIIGKEQVDAIQVNDFYNLLGATSKIFGFKGKLLTYVRFLPFVMPSPLRNLWVGLGLRYSHKVIAVSDAVLKQLPAHTKAVRMYDPVQLTEELPEKDYTAKEVVSILYLANYIQGKGQDAALEAFAQAYQKNDSIKLTFMGGDMGLEKNREFKNELEQRTKEFGLASAVNFLPFNNNVEQSIKGADIVLNFSEAESFSMTCLEAAFYGTALIATRCGGPEEIVVHERTGITVPVNDINAMRDAILALTSDTELRKQYAKAGKEYVRHKFNIETYKQQMRQILSAT